MTSVVYNFFSYAVDIDKCTITNLDTIHHAFPTSPQVTIKIPYQIENYIVTAINPFTKDIPDTLNQTIIFDASDATQLENFGSYFFYGTSILGSKIQTISFIGNTQILKINDHAFNNLINLEEVFFINCNGLNFLSDSTFNNCAKLRVARFSGQSITLSNYMFNNCSSLLSLTFSNFSSMNTFRGYVCNNCTNLEEIRFLNCSNSEINLSNFFFNGAQNLKTFDFSTSQNCTVILNAGGENVSQITNIFFDDTDSISLKKLQVNYPQLTNIYFDFANNPIFETGFLNNHAVNVTSIDFSTTTNLVLPPNTFVNSKVQALALPLSCIVDANDLVNNKIKVVFNSESSSVYDVYFSCLISDTIDISNLPDHLQATINENNFVISGSIFKGGSFEASILINSLSLKNIFFNSAPCFLAKTKVLLYDKSEKEIQDLQVGDILTSALDGSPVKVKKLYRNVVDESIAKENYPMRIRAHFFDNNLPKEDVFLSGYHRILLSTYDADTILGVQAFKINSEFLSFEEAKKISEKDQVVYYNVELDSEKEKGMIVSGLAVESYSN